MKILYCSNFQLCDTFNVQHCYIEAVFKVLLGEKFSHCFGCQNIQAGTKTGKKDLKNVVSMIDSVAGARTKDHEMQTLTVTTMTLPTL